MEFQSLTHLKSRTATVNEPDHPWTRDLICVHQNHPLLGDLRECMRFSQVFTDNGGFVQRVPPDLDWEVYAEHNDTIAQVPQMVFADGVPGTLSFNGVRIRWEADLPEQELLRQKGGPVVVDLPINENCQIWVRWVADKLVLRLGVGTRQIGDPHGMIENTMRGFVLMNRHSTGLKALKLTNGIRKMIIKELDNEYRAKPKDERGKAPVPAEGLPITKRPEPDDTDSDEEDDDDERQ